MWTIRGSYIYMGLINIWNQDAFLINQCTKVCLSSSVGTTMAEKFCITYYSTYTHSGLNYVFCFLLECGPHILISNMGQLFSTCKSPCIHIQKVPMGAHLVVLPTLNGDLTLEVFTHWSLFYNSMRKHPIYSESSYLAELDEHAVNIAVCVALFNSKFPMQSAEEMLVMSFFMPTSTLYDMNTDDSQWNCIRCNYWTMGEFVWYARETLTPSRCSTFNWFSDCM